MPNRLSVSSHRNGDPLPPTSQAHTHTPATNSPTLPSPWLLFLSWASGPLERQIQGLETQEPLGKGC